MRILRSGHYIAKSPARIAQVGYDPVATRAIRLARFKARPYRNHDFKFYRLPAELEAALLEFAQWSDAHLSAEETATTPTSPLYHYTRAPNLEKILESQRLWCFSHADQSDKKEFSYSLQLAMSELDRIERSGVPFADEFARCTRDLIQRHDLTKVFSFYLFSLSESRDLESQWDKYAEKGTGYQLGFAPRLFLPTEPLSPHAERNAHVGKLIYGNAESSLAHREVLDKAAEIVSRIGMAHAGAIFASKRVHGDYINGMAKEVIARQLIWRSVVSKRECFRPEAERRFVIMNLQSRLVGKAQTLADGRSYVPYCIPLAEPGNLVEVLIGPNAAADAKDYVVKLLDRLGYKGAAVSRSTKRV